MTEMEREEREKMERTHKEIRSDGRREVKEGGEIVEKIENRSEGSPFHDPWVL